MRSYGRQLGSTQRSSYRQAPYPPLRYPPPRRGPPYRSHRFNSQESHDQLSNGCQYEQPRRQNPTYDNPYYQMANSGHLQQNRRNNSPRRFKEPRQRMRYIDPDRPEQRKFPDIEPDRPDQRKIQSSHYVEYDATQPVPEFGSMQEWQSNFPGAATAVSSLLMKANSAEQVQNKMVNSNLRAADADSNQGPEISNQTTNSNKQKDDSRKSYDLWSWDGEQIHFYPYPPEIQLGMKSKPVIESPPFDDEKDLPLWGEYCRQQRAICVRAGLSEDEAKMLPSSEAFLKASNEYQDNWARDYGKKNYPLYKKMDLLKGNSDPTSRGEGFFELITEDQKYGNKKRPRELLKRIEERRQIIGERKYMLNMRAIMKEICSQA